MVQLPTIHLIHTSDALQHLGRVKEILQQLKAEHRISTFITWRLEDGFTSLREKVASGDLVLALLTQSLETRKEEIEQLLRNARAQTPDLEIAEIIVDNIPYENEFITFPPDLKPIRSREDMDAVWRDIAQNLRAMFPVQATAESEASTSQWSKYLKIAGIVILVVVIAFFLARLFGNNGTDRIPAAEVEEVTEEAVPVEKPAEDEKAVEQPVEEAENK